MERKLVCVAGLSVLAVAGAPLADAVMSVTGTPVVARAIADDNTPENMVAFFMETGCPTGWSVYSAGEGRLLLGVDASAAGKVGTTVGSPLADQEDRTHKHSYSTQVDLGSRDIEAESHNNDDSASPGKKDVPQTPPGTTAAVSSGTPMAQLTVCKKTTAPTDADAADPYPQSALAFFDAQTCPVGSDANNPNWEAVTLKGSGLGYFLVPFFNPPAATVGALVSDGLAPGQDRTHTHTFSSSITTDSLSYAGVWGCQKWLDLCTSITESGTKSFSGTTAAGSTGIPYVTLLLCKKTAFTKSSNPPEDVPTFVATFLTAQNCPTGWKMTATTTGRYLVGLPTGGTPGVTFGGDALKPTDKAATPVASHDHTFSGSVATGDRKVDLVSGGQAKDAGKKGTYSYSGTTGTTAADLPYYGVIQCQPCIANDPDQDCQTNQ